MYFVCCMAPVHVRVRKTQCIQVVLKDLYTYKSQKCDLYTICIVRYGLTILYQYFTRSLSGVGNCDSMLTCPDVSYRTCTRNKSYRKNNICKLEIDLFCKGFQERDIVPPMYLMVERSLAVQYLFLRSLLAANFCT